MREKSCQEIVLGQLDTFIGGKKPSKFLILYQISKSNQNELLPKMKHLNFKLLRRKQTEPLVSLNQVMLLNKSLKVNM